VVTARRPSTVIFDVVETLLSLQPVGDALEAAGGPPNGLQLCFARLLRDGFALTMSGHRASFASIAAGAVRSVVPDIDDDAVNQVLAAFSALPAHPDAAPALARLASAGTRIAALTNGAAATTGALLAASGLHRYVSEVISVEEVGPWKPAPAPYLHAAATLAVAPTDLALVAVHSWDIHGARAAGLTTGWASRLERTRPPTFDQADVSGSDLIEVTDGLLALPER